MPNYIAVAETTFSGKKIRLGFKVEVIFLTLFGLVNSVDVANDPDMLDALLSTFEGQDIEAVRSSTFDVLGADGKKLARKLTPSAQIKEQADLIAQLQVENEQLRSELALAEQAANPESNPDADPGSDADPGPDA